VESGTVTVEKVVYLNTLLAARSGWAAILLLPIIQCGLIGPFQNKTDFILLTLGRDSATVDVDISTDPPIDPMPVITVNGKPSDAPPTNGEWLFTRISSDSSIKYRIEWSSDIIEDEIQIPSRIDSLLYSGINLPYCPEDFMVNTVTIIDSAAAYQFSWKTAKPASEFRIKCMSCLTKDGFLRRFITSPLFTYYPDTICDYTPEILLSVNSYQHTDYPLNPNKTSNKMRVFYDLYGPTFSSRLQIKQN
jgi:hypothetical protein